MEHSETATSFQGKKNEEHDAPTCGQSQAYDSDGNTKKTKGNDTQRYCNTEIIFFAQLLYHQRINHDSLYNC